MPESLSSSTRIAIVPLLLAGLRHAKVGLALKDVSGRYIYLAGLPEYFPRMPAAEATDEKLFGHEVASELTEAQSAVLSSGEPTALEIRGFFEDTRGLCECTVHRYVVEDGTPALLLTFVDMTEERRREDALRALLRELSHRSKNMLAIVQSIAAKTARTVDRPEDFLPKFRGRIAALSSAQDLVTDSNWRGARFHDLARAQFRRYVEENDGRVAVVGANPVLSPNQVTHLALAIHELIANSVASGALSREHGQVTLECTHEGTNRLRIEWTENPGTGEAMPQAPEKRFGSAVLERIVPTAVNGRADYLLDSQSVSYRIEFPEE
jgi:two-component sensor histidine kinase